MEPHHSFFFNFAGAHQVDQDAAVINFIASSDACFRHFGCG